MKMRELLVVSSSVRRITCEANTAGATKDKRNMHMSKCTSNRVRQEGTEAGWQEAGQSVQRQGNQCGLPACQAHVFCTGSQRAALLACAAQPPPPRTPPCLACMLTCSTAQGMASVDRRCANSLAVLRSLFVSSLQHSGQASFVCKRHLLRLNKVWPDAVCACLPQRSIVEWRPANTEVASHRGSGRGCSPPVDELVLLHKAL